MARKLPIIFFGLIALVWLTYQWMPPIFQSILYGISLSIKSVIVFLLPFLIFGLLFKTSVYLAKKATKWILFLVAAICLSNFFTTMLSYLVGNIAYQFDLSITLPSPGSALVPLGNISLPTMAINSYAMFSGLLFGLLCGWLRPTLAGKIAFQLEKYITFFFKSFLYVIPLFILGFIVKMMHDGVMSIILRNYSVIFGIVVSAAFIYIALLYFIASNFQPKIFVRSIKNMLPATLVGFGSMSSAAAMPLTILGTERNSKDPDIARSIIPATVNIHLIGDCFAIPIFAFAVMKSFGFPEPSIFSYLIFAAYFVLAKFSVAAVPGGGILVMLPILETYLGFNSEMLSLITALYILFDPVITSANVLGNGAFAMGMGNLISSRKNF